ncbi:pimeloyl-ACP methyl ester carboxylesterase [Paraburkholderia sp. GAS199]|uniref:alpha/beta fold hydrolase n=1 Tax=Paraburkholderia sp. GAS199 TaxID=3035126 RepID=UPI003D1F59E9
MMANPSTMRPVIFDGCFGWLHQPLAAQPSMGVVLCSPFGYDALCAHRGWREFAEALAARGMPVVRFDYPGTGDSSGSEDDPARLRAWIDSIKAAAALLRAKTGVTRLTLCGLRLGATLAALAAEEMEEIENLVLLLPATSGKSYARELDLAHQSWLRTQAGIEGIEGVGSSHDTEKAKTVGAHGFRLYPDTLATLADVDLERRTQRPAQRVLIQDLGEGARIKRLAARYQTLGAHAELQIYGEYSKFLIDPHYSVPPRNAFDSVLEWLGASAVEAGEPAAEILACAPGARIDFADGRETPVIFGGGRYVGIYCQPRRALDGVPAVLFVNTGGVHRVGDGRVAVLMARRLAAQGIASLRMDLGGLGDSVRLAQDQTLDMVYSGPALADAKAGIDWLVAAGHAKAVMFGVCTGAYVAIHTALTHSAVVGCAAVNLPFFVWGSAASRPGARPVASKGVYRLSIRNPRKWLRLLTGRANGTAITAEFVRRMIVRAGVRVNAAVEYLMGQSTPRGAIRRLALELDRKGVQTSLMYGPLDEGRDELEMYFGRDGNELGKLKNVDAKVIAKVDHALFSQVARDAIMLQFEQFLRERVLSARRETVVQTAGLCVAEVQQP